MEFVFANVTIPIPLKGKEPCLHQQSLMLVNRIYLLLIFVCLSGIVRAQEYSKEHCDFLEEIERLEKTESHKQALELCEARLDQLNSSGSSPELFSTYQITGKVLFHQNEYKKAIAVLRPLKNAKPGSDPAYIDNWADCMYWLGKTYDYNGQIDSAMYFLKMALNARLDLPAPAPQEMADNYSYLGYLYCFEKKNFAVAERYYLQEEEQLEIFDAPATRWCSHYINLGATYAERDYQHALNSYYKALSYCDTSVSFILLKRKLYNNIANMWYRQRKYQQAIMYYRRVLKLSDPNGHNAASDVTALENMGDAFKFLGQLDSSRFFLSKAQRITLETYGENSLEKAESDLMLSQVTEDHEEALALRQNALSRKLQHYDPLSAEMRRVHGMIGFRFRETGNRDSALYYFQKGIFGSDLPQDYAVLPEVDYDNITLVSSLLKQKASLLLEYGREMDSVELLSISVSHFRLVADIYQSFLIYRQSEAERLYFVKSAKETYDLAMEAAFLRYQKTGKGLEDIWYFMEQSKGTVLLLQEYECSERVYPEADQQLLSMKRHLVGRVKYYEETLRQNSLPADTVRLTLFDLNRKLDSINRLMGDNEQLLNAVHQDRLLELNEVSDLLQVEQQCLVHFYIADDRMYVLKMDKVKGDVQIIAGDDFKKVRRFAKDLRQVLSAGGGQGVEGFQQFTQSASALYNLLLKPLNLVNYKNILVIPDGFLSGIPLEVLLTSPVPERGAIGYRNLPYLLKQSRISYGYSAGWMGMDEVEWRSEPMSLLAFAYASDANDQNANGKLDLPASLEEVNTLGSVWGKNFVSFSGGDASEANFKLEQPGYNMLHLATHNEVDTANALNSGIVFRSGEDRKEDGILHIHEIYQLQPRNRLVVLSTCESGVGEYQEGEGFLSVGRAFAQLGTPFIVSSLWKTSDRFSTDLMKKFYSELKEGADPTEALHQSKIGFLKESDELKAHPANWASYIVMGKPGKRIIQQKSLFAGTYLWIGAGMLLFVFLIITLRKANRQGT